MVSGKEEKVEPYVILPFPTYRAMDQKLKRAELPEKELPTEHTEPSQEEEEREKEKTPTPPLTSTSAPPATNKDLTTKYRANQIKKLLQHIKKNDSTQDITSLDNLEALIKSALTNSRKILPNEKKFYAFLFDNNLAHFCKNRSKINLYYLNKDSWYHV